MLEAEAVVVAVHGSMAEVEVASGAGCGHCHTDGGCGGGRSLLGLGRRPSVRLEVSTHLNLAPGDRVTLGLPEGGYLRASVALYLVPLLTMFAGAGVLEALGPAGADLLVLAGGLLGLGVGFFWLRGFSRRMGADPRSRPRILRRQGGRSLPTRPGDPDPGGGPRA